LSTLVSLLTESKRLGFLGPGAVEHHVEHAGAFLAAVTSPPARLLDLGSGGGVPGLVLATAWTTTSCTLLDSQLRRVRFLEHAIEALGLADRVAVVHGRAEELARVVGHRGTYDLVTARSFGVPAITAECGAGFLVAGGALVVSEPPELDDARWPAGGLAALGLQDDGVVRGPSSAVRVLRSPAAALDRVPRRAPAMARTPAF
jgi:16S rRNA (guanine527-N7)-methyltransferase